MMTTINDSAYFVANADLLSIGCQHSNGDQWQIVKT